MSQPHRVFLVFGTRPEAIKLAPVYRALARRGERFAPVGVASGQHGQLLRPLADELGLAVDHDLAVMTPGQGPSDVAARVLAQLDPLLAEQRPDAVLVQGDTTTALAAALAAFHRGVPVAHVEAGLRTGDPASPFPEEMNRRLVGRIARWHFAATPGNADALRGEGVDAAAIAVTGNPVVDALRHMLATSEPSLRVRGLLDGLKPQRLVVLTSHRRESFGATMVGHLRALRRFVERARDTVVVFPVHPNPAVGHAVGEALGGAERVHCIEPLPYRDFLHLLERAWLVVSDSGGVQEEVTALGKPLIVLRESTERPEAVACGAARLAGRDPLLLAHLLDEAHRDPAWSRRASRTPCPFGAGDAGERIAEALARFLAADAS